MLVVLLLCFAIGFALAQVMRHVAFAIVRRARPERLWVVEMLGPTPAALSLTAIAVRRALARMDAEAHWIDAVDVVVLTMLGLLVLQIVRVVAAAARRAVERPSAKLSVVVPFAIRLARVAWLVFGAAMFATALGATYWKVTTAIGVLSAAVAVAGRRAGDEIVSGLTLALSEPFRRRDRIRLTDDRGGVIEGRVERLEIFATRLRSPDGNPLLVPNTRMVTMAIENLGPSDPELRGSRDGAEPRR